MVDKKDLVVGDIKKCTKMVEHWVNSGSGGYWEMEDEHVCYNAVLLKTSSGNYIELNSVYMAELLTQKVIPQVNWMRMVGITLSPTPQNQGDYFVDETTIRPYETFINENGLHNNVGHVKQLKRTSS